MGRPVVHFEITGGDARALQGGIAQGPEGYGGHGTVYVQVPDAVAALARAQALGAARMMGPTEVSPGLVVGLFTDPAGHVVGVMEP
jgi:predicted enzyme related to lactoylglutathione lyase